MEGLFSPVPFICLECRPNTTTTTLSSLIYDHRYIIRQLERSEQQRPYLTSKRREVAELCRWRIEKISHKNRQNAVNQVDRDTDKKGKEDEVTMEWPMFFSVGSMKKKREGAKSAQHINQAAKRKGKQKGNWREIRERIKKKKRKKKQSMPLRLLASAILI